MTSQKEKRGAVSARRRRQLLLLVSELQRQQPNYPDITGDIQDLCDDLTRLAMRTREADRQQVIDSLTNWHCVGSTANELMEDTALSERVIRGVLEELKSADPPIVIVTGERAPDGGRGRPAEVYDLASA
jgi:hypothetical protein